MLEADLRSSKKISTTLTAYLSLMKGGYRMSLKNRVEKLESTAENKPDDNADYTLNVGLDQHQYTKTVNGETVDITEGEWEEELKREEKNNFKNFKIIGCAALESQPQKEGV